MTSLGKQSGSSNLRLAVLLLAAGEGSRLGSTPKALLHKDGQSLLSHFSHSIKAFSPIEFLVVTGFYADVIESELAKLKADLDLPIEYIRNPQPELGQASSVRLGLEALKSAYDVLLIALCDQPLVGSIEINVLLQQFKQRDQQKEVLLPMVGKQRGNPVVFSAKVIADILAIPQMVCRPFMDQHPELVQIFATDDQAYIADVDTESELSQFGLKRF
ncbi:nucleotidyltransferase family protein [Polynucleobacter nymphae]|uniref:nucleotidyltransferase family protein n=1 Tax=Polynucleobacter nymphae TaxID=2081043 RepID=UPI001C0B1034|nr:nucleotidyltransferase family protein [Polynucleobacter nymphae]MBU3607027.1 nucleotidyltransferase family protein [Polynucleobacter nymphae]